MENLSINENIPCRTLFYIRRKLLRRTSLEAFLRLHSQPGAYTVNQFNLAAIKVSVFKAVNIRH